MKKITFIPILFVLFVGCQSVDQFSPDQVMEHAMASENKEVPYYGEMTMTLKDADGTFEMEVEEWRKEDKSLEKVTADGETMVTLREGNKVSTYDETDNVLYETEYDDMDEVNLTSKERLENILELTEDTHTLVKKDNETIAGRETIHLVAEKKPDEKSLFGTQEIWIDKENWLVLKTADHTADSFSVMEYTKLELDAQIDDDVFALDLPDDVAVESFSDELEEEEITLDEAVEKLDGTFLYLEENDQLAIEEITYFEDTEHDETEKSVDISYNKEGLPYMDLSIYQKEDSNEDELDEEDDLSESITIRGESGEYVDFDEMKMISWQEEDLEYSMWFINPNITLEEMISLTDDMEKVPTN